MKDLHGLLTSFTFGDIVIVVEILDELVAAVLGFSHVFLSEVLMIFDLRAKDENDVIW